MTRATDSNEFVALILTALADREVLRALRGALCGALPPTHVIVKAFAARWSVGTRLVGRWLHNGLPAKHIDRLVRIPLAEGDAWVTDLAKDTHAGTSPS